MQSLHSFARLCCCIILSGFSLITSVHAQSASEYKFINAQNTTTLEKELNQQAADGWRLFRFPKSWLGDAVGALLMRSSEADKNVKYEYKILAARRIGTLENEFKKATADGYEFRSIVSLYRAGDMAMDYFLSNGGETMIVLERPQGATKARFEYQFLAVKLESTLQKELAEIAKQGFRPLEMVRGFNNSIKRTTFALIVPGGSLMRKEERTLIAMRDLSLSTEETNKAPNLEYKFLATKKVATLEKEMNEAAKAGFRFHSSSPGLLTLMTRDVNDKSPKQRFEYKLLATRMTTTMQKEMQEMGEQGFNYISTSSSMGEVATLFERDLDKAVGTDKKEYLLLATRTDTATGKELNDALNNGYQFRDITKVGEYIVILDRSNK